MPSSSRGSSIPAVMATEYDCGTGAVITTASAATTVASSMTTSQACPVPGCTANTSVEQRTSSPAARCLARAFIPPTTA